MKYYWKENKLSHCSNPNTETSLINGGNKSGPRTIHPL